MTKYRKTTPLVDAYKYDTSEDTYVPTWVILAIAGKVILTSNDSTDLTIPNEVGSEVVKEGDWIVRDQKGRIFWVPAKDFEKDYEAVRVV